MKIKDESNWNGVGTELTDVSFIAKAAIPFSNSAQKRFDAHSTMVEFINDGNSEICLSRQGSEFYLNARQKSRLSVSLGETIQFVSGKTLYTLKVNSNHLNAGQILASTSQKADSSSEPITVMVFIFVILNV